MFRFLSLAAVSAFVVVLAACSGGASPTRSEPNFDATPTALTNASAIARVSPPPGPADERLPIPLDVSFIDANRGWVLAVGDSTARGRPEAWLGNTTDGGATWKALPPPEVTLDAVSRVRFVDASDGWLYGPDWLSTHNGGQTWQREPRDGEVLALEISGASVWAVERTPCDPPAPKGPNQRDQPPADCPLSLRTSNDAGRTWRAASFPGKLTLPPWQFGPMPRLIRQGRDDAWFLAAGQLFATHDGAASWTDLSGALPNDGSTIGLAMTDTSHVWLLTAGVGATVMQSKFLYHSDDGGSSWQIVAGASFPGDPRDLHTMPTVGHPAGIVAAGGDRLFLLMGRNTLYGSFDVGHTWSPLIPRDLAFPGDGGVGPVVFANSERGWAVAQPGIFRSIDGGATWTLTRLPRDFPPPVAIQP